MAEPIDVPKGSALDDLRRKREDQRQMDAETKAGAPNPSRPYGQSVVKKAKGGSISSASKRADGCAQRGKTKGKML